MTKKTCNFSLSKYPRVRPSWSGIGAPVCSSMANSRYISSNFSFRTFRRGSTAWNRRKCWLKPGGFGIVDTFRYILPSSSKFFRSPVCFKVQATPTKPSGGIKMSSTNTNNKKCCPWKEPESSPPQKNTATPKPDLNLNGSENIKTNVQLARLNLLLWRLSCF